MARMVELKSAKEIEQLAKQARMHLVEPGLYLQVKGDAQSWIHCYTFKGKARWSGLGSYPDVGLAGARGKHKDEQAELRAGADSVAERKRKREEKAVEQQPKKTFREVATTYVADNESAWKKASPPQTMDYDPGNLRPSSHR